MQRIALSLAGVFALALAGCPSDNGGGTTGGTGGGGAGGRGGSSGTGGSAGTGGTGGSAGTGGARPPDAGRRDTGRGPDSGRTPDGGRRDGGGVDMGGAAAATTSFFVTSDTSMNGNLGGLAGADARCQRLATAAGLGSKTWKAYLSADMGPGGMPVNARDRIGMGPWFNARGQMIAANLTELHGRTGNADLFLDEKGIKVNGQWGRVTMGAPNEHDILTGTNPDGTVAMGKNCTNWTSAMGPSRVGHSDGLGPNMNPAAPFNSWHSSHDGSNGGGMNGCANTAPGGGTGRIYCFASN